MTANAALKLPKYMRLKRNAAATTGFQCAVGIGIVVRSHNQSPDYGRDNPACGEQQREDYACLPIKYDAQRQRRYQGSHIRLEQVGSHTGHITYIIAYIVCDDSRVPGVVFRDSGFHFSNQVGAYIGRFGVNSASDTGE